MTNDPAETFRADQQAAADETATREALAWAHHVREADGLAEMRRAEAARTFALGRLYASLAAAISFTVLVGIGAAVYVLVDALVDR